MGSALLLRDDFDGRALRQLARQTKDANRRGGCWRSPRFMTAARARMRHGSAA